MRILTVILATFVAMASLSSASAATICRCTSETLPPSGHCNQFGDCKPVLELVGTFKPLRSVKACGRSQAVVCDFNSCSLVCAPPAQ